MKGLLKTDTRVSDQQIWGRAQELSFLTSTPADGDAAGWGSYFETH